MQQDTPNLHDRVGAQFQYFDGNFFRRHPCERLSCDTPSPVISFSSGLHGYHADNIVIRCRMLSARNMAETLANRVSQIDTGAGRQQLFVWAD